MFTSRAEFRLSLRADNADERLTGTAINLGIASHDRQARFGAREKALRDARELAQSLTLTPNEAAQYGLELNRDGVRRSAYDLLSRPDLELARLAEIWPQLRSIDPGTSDRLATEARYAVYLHRQDADVALLRREQSTSIPEEVDYSNLPGLSNELKQKLQHRRPRTIADAQRIDGITPSALAIVLAAIRSAELRGAA